MGDISIIKIIIKVNVYKNKVDKNYPPYKIHFRLRNPILQFNNITLKFRGFEKS